MSHRLDYSLVLAKYKFTSFYPTGPGRSILNSCPSVSCPITAAIVSTSGDLQDLSPCLRLFCCLENNYCVVRSFRQDRTALRDLIALVNAVQSSIGRRRGPQVALALLFLQTRVQFLAFVSISNVKSLGVALRMLFPRL